MHFAKLDPDNYGGIRTNSEREASCLYFIKPRSLSSRRIFPLRWSSNAGRCFAVLRETFQIEKLSRFRKSSLAGILLLTVPADKRPTFWKS
jgi:hypothetical protein